MRTASFPLLIALLSASPLQAQRLEDATSAFRSTPAAAFSTGDSATARSDRSPLIDSVRVAEPSGPKMLLLGTALGTVGMFGGGAMGYAMESCSPGEWFCGLAGAIIGGAIGTTVMLPLGVHLGGQNSTYGRKVGVAATVVLVGFGLAPLTSGASLLMIPPAQLISTMAVEYRAARRTER